MTDNQLARQVIDLSEKLREETTRRKILEKVIRGFRVERADRFQNMLNQYKEMYKLKQRDSLEVRDE